MKKLLVLVFLFGVATAQTKSEPAPEKLVNWMRSLNTAESRFVSQNHRFASTAELLEYARTKMNFAAEHDLQPTSLAPYTLQITTSSDGQHYQIALTRSADVKDKTTWCKLAVFSDDSGLIYTGKNIGCEEKQTLAGE